MGHGPPSPFLATAPLNAAPRRRRRRWGLVTAVVGSTALVVLLVALAVVPVAQSAAEDYSMANAGSALSTATEAISFPHGGTYDFSWATTNRGSAQFTLTGPSGTMLYSSNSAGGTGSIAVSAGATYTIGLYDWLPETVDVSGTLHYSAPLL